MNSLRISECTGRSLGSGSERAGRGPRHSGLPSGRGTTVPAPSDCHRSYKRPKRALSMSVSRGPLLRVSEYRIGDTSRVRVPPHRLRVRAGGNLAEINE